jgi:hypothetical protein
MTNAGTANSELNFAVRRSGVLAFAILPRADML